MRSHDGYRALVVFATVLVYMHGTLAVRIAGSASRRNGESSSLLWFSRASFRLALSYLRLSCRSLPLSLFASGTALFPLRTDPFHLMVTLAHRLLRLLHLTTCFFLFLLLLFLLRLLRESNTPSSSSRSSSL